MKQGFTVWLTGLSGAGKSTVAGLLMPELAARGHSVELLDGDEVRKNLSSGLGFSRQDRDANIRRIGWVSAMATRNGAAVIAAAISPYRDIRDEVGRQIGNFVEVYVMCPLETLKQRDPKGLHKKAIAGEIEHFTGISDPYEEPLSPDVVIETDTETPAESTRKVLNRLIELGYVSGDQPPVTQMGPHGGLLVERMVSGDAAAALRAEAESLPSVQLSAREQSDLDLIGFGALSPLTGFMGRPDYQRVLEEMRLAGGLPWSMPITLSAPRHQTAELSMSGRIALRDTGGSLRGVMNVEDVYEYGKSEEARRIFLTEDEQHPGVAALYEQGEMLVGGKVQVLGPPVELEGIHLPPAVTRALFKSRSWRTVVGFQTRNPVHRAHEYLLKTALEMSDGIFLNPLTGTTKRDDVPAEVRMDCYKVLLREYFPEDRVVLGVLPAAMRYAGPREAIFHALVRKNYGCTRLIVGRDHAGVKDYYGPYDAQRIFDRFEPGELGISPISFENTFYCRKCGGMASSKTCPHPTGDHLMLSGTRVRERLAAGESLPPEFTRPEVAEVLRRHYDGSTADRTGAVKD